MRWFFSHLLTAFVVMVASFVALAVAGWIAAGFGVAVIVLVAGSIAVAIALPPLMMYYDENTPPTRFPDSLR